jgi:hypothetical protein
MHDAPFASATATVVKARNTVPVARIAPSERLWIEISYIATVVLLTEVCILLIGLLVLPSHVSRLRGLVVI